MMNIGAWQNGGTNIGAWQSGAAITADFSPAFVDATEFDIIEFRADNIEGVPVVGCPIGETYYKSPFAAGDFTGTGTIEPDKVTVEDSESGDPWNYMTLLGTPTSIGTLKFSVIFALKSGANIDWKPLLTSGRETFFSVTAQGVYFEDELGSGYALNGDYLSTDFVFAMSIDLCADSSATYTVSVYNAGMALLETETISRAVGAWVPNLVYALSLTSWNSVQEYYECDIVADRGLPNPCTGETLDCDIAWKLTSTGETVATGTPADIPMLSSYDGDSMTGVITSGSDSLTSAPIPLAVWDGKTNKIIQGGSSVSLYTAYKNKTRISLDMDRAIDSGGIVQWLDYGKETDDYTGSFHVETEEAQKIEQMICSGTADNMLITTPCENGFYPFGMGFSTGQNYTVNVSKSDVDGNVDIFGTARGYKFNFVASDTPYGDLVENTAVAGGIDEAWLLGGVDIPFSEWGNSLNTIGGVVQTFGGSSNTAMGSRNYGDIAKININCSEEQARRIIQYICKTMRGNTVIATLGDYHVFGRRYEEMTSCTCRLYSNILDIEQQGQNSVDIKFTLQMVGE